jgi:hypothetical protein
VITIHPAFSAFDFFNNTPATTPSPNNIKRNVPINSAKKLDNANPPSLILNNLK